MGYNFQTSSELYCLAQGSGTMYAKKGSMVAYKGDFKFDKVLLDTNGGGFMKGLMNQVTRRLSGENLSLMEVTGNGEIYFADEAQHVTILELDPGDELSVESENLLCFNDSCNYSVKFLGVGVISQKGLFTSKLTPKGNGAAVAIKSDGNPLLLTSPCCVDPDAVVCWLGPDPDFKINNFNWKTVIGQTSGETYMLDFKQPGYTVVVQPSERLSGLKLGIDDKSYTPHSQGTAGGILNNLFR